MPDASVIIVNWNSKQYLMTCLESIERHTHAVTAEIIVVDNASSDGTAEELRKRYPDVKLIESDVNAGFAKAITSGSRGQRGGTSAW